MGARERARADNYTEGRIMAIGKFPLAGLITLLWVGMASADTLRIELATGTEEERSTRREIKKLAGEHHLDGWLFTRRIRIDADAVPHSHPVLTIHARHRSQPERLLSTFVHEQIHWLFSVHEKATGLVIRDLRRIYANVPVGYPDGAKTLESSYLHLLVILFEFDSMRHLLGDDRAREVMRFWSEDHYRQLYKIVLEDHERIRQLARRHDFRCCPPEGPQ